MFFFSPCCSDVQVCSSKTHFWPHSGWAASRASSQKIKVCMWLIHITSIPQKNRHRGLKGTASSSTATKRNPAFEQRDKDLEWEILKDLCQSKSWQQRSTKQPANKESRLSEKVTTTDREDYNSVVCIQKCRSNWLQESTWQEIKDTIGRTRSSAVPGPSNGL